MASIEPPPTVTGSRGLGLRRLSRRVRTLIVSGVLFVVLFVLVFTMSVPYVILSPGPTYNTLGTDDQGNQIIQVVGGKVNKTSGNLNMTTVGVSGGSVTPFEALKGWLSDDEVVVPRTSVYPPGQSQQQTDQQNTQDFVVSQDSAKVAALCELGYPAAFGVVTVVKGGPSAGVLKVGDALISVDGKAVNDSAKLTAVLKAEKPGTTVDVVLTRDKVRRTVQVTLGSPPKNQTGARFGIEVSNTCLAPFDIDLGLANQIGGPSAGLMFALGIIDKIGSKDLTQGRFIAGTGTIDTKGNVGPIGGIALKMIAAKRKGATIFLAPADNCPDVVKSTPAGLKIVKVSTLHGALQDLERIESNQSVPSC